jgi:hypothetical protein
MEVRHDQPVAVLGARACRIVEAVLDHAHDDVALFAVGADSLVEEG